MMPRTGARGKGRGCLPPCTLEMPTLQSRTGPTTSANNYPVGVFVEVGGHPPKSNGGALNPALNPVLLKVLFSACPVQLLASCRLVCSTWYKESLPTWRTLATPKFTYTTKLNGYITIRPQMDPASSFGVTTSLSQFVNFWPNNCRTFPYQKFQLEGWPFGGGMKTKEEGAEALKPPNDNQAQLERLFLNQLLRVNAKSLTLRQCKFVDAEEFRKVIYTAFPKLESLVLHFPIFPEAVLTEPGSGVTGSNKKKVKKTPVYKEHPQLTSLTLNCHGLEDLPVSCVELLSHFPSLTCLKLGYQARKHDYWPHFRATAPFTQVLLDAIDIIRRVDPSKLPLKEFEMDPCLGLSNDETSRQIVSLVRKLSLPILTVRINVDCGLKLIQEFITSHGGSLRKLEVFKDDEDHRFLRWLPPPSPVFPYGVELTSLQEITIGHGLVNSLEFLKYTPNLVRLRMFDILEDICGRDSLKPLHVGLLSSTSKNKLVDLKLKGLKRLYFGYSLSEDDLKCFGRWFPNLENLNLFLDDEKFAMVCEIWPRLTHLHVLGKYLTDKGITGRRMTPGNGSAAVPEALRPNITDLKELRCVRVEPTWRPLTDASALHGFLKLPKLESLEISGATHQFGKEVKKILYRTVRHCSISCSVLWARMVNTRDWCITGTSNSD